MSLLEKAGAWWLGFCITAGLFLLVGLLFLLFPKWFKEPNWLLRRRERYYKKLIAKKRQADKRKLVASKAKKKSDASGRTKESRNKNSGRNNGRKGDRNSGKGSRKEKHQKTSADYVRSIDPPRNSWNGNHEAVNQAFDAGETSGAQGNGAASELQEMGEGRKRGQSHHHQSHHHSNTAHNSNGNVGTKTMNYIKRKRNMKRTKKYLMRREQFKGKHNVRRVTTNSNVNTPALLMFQTYRDTSGDCCVTRPWLCASVAVC